VVGNSDITSMAGERFVFSDNRKEFKEITLPSFWSVIETIEFQLGGWKKKGRGTIGPLKSVNHAICIDKWTSVRIVMERTLYVTT